MLLPREKQAVVKGSAEAVCTYNVHVQTCLDGFLCVYLSAHRGNEHCRVTQREPEELFEAFAFDVRPATQRGPRLRASRAVCSQTSLHSPLTSYRFPSAGSEFPLFPRALPTNR